MTGQPSANLAGLVLSILLALAAGCAGRAQSESITFEECARLGGVAWQVDLDHPDICPPCAEYRACEVEYNDVSESCPECYEACPECRDRYSLHESCPECYGPCQDCRNQYLNDFASEEEKDRLCPVCKECNDCRERLNRQVAACPPCISCEECKEKNKRYSDIREACPQVAACTECMQDIGTYPEICPDGRKKIAQIRDAAIWFQCCE